MGVSICVDGRDNFYIPIGHRPETWLGSTTNIKLSAFILSQTPRDVPYVFHNAKFDIHVLKRIGLIFPKDFLFYDTMLMCHLIDENEREFSLEKMAQKYIGSGKEIGLARILSKDMEWEDTPGFIMEKYACRDAQATYELYTILKPMFTEYEQVWKRDSQFLMLLQEMERKGVPVDLSKVQWQKDLCLQKMHQIQKEIGFNPGKTKDLHSRLFDSPPVGHGLKVLSRTPKTKKPQVNTRFYEMNWEVPLCQSLREHAQLKQLVGLYYNPYQNLCQGYERLHASFKQHGTVTGRLSCATPNMQQLPRVQENPNIPNMKECFTAEPGKELWEIDFKNLEMRLAAVYSKEESLLATFQEEGDVHQLTANLLGISRQFAKVINFLIIYGGGAPALAYQLRIPLEQAKIIKEAFDHSYPRLTVTRHQATEATERNGGWIKLWTGRKRHFRYSNDYHKAFNSIIQGGGFEIVKKAMLNLKDFDIRNQVHDSVWIMANSYNEIKEAESLMFDWTTDAFGLTFSVESKQLA